MYPNSPEWEKTFIGVPLLILPSGTMGDNGSITLGTALSVLHPDIYGYLPDSAIYSGSAAGIYYIAMSSTTIGTVYNNTYTADETTIPASPTAFVCTGPGAYAQSTSEITLFSTIIAGGKMGVKGTLQTYISTIWNNSAGFKNVKGKIATNLFLTLSGTTSLELTGLLSITNAGSEAKQFVYGNIIFGATTGSAPTRKAVNTASDFTYTITAQLPANTDYAGISQLMLRIIK